MTNKALYHIDDSGPRTKIIRLEDNKVIRTFKGNAEAKTIINYLKKLPGLEMLKNYDC